MELAWGNVTANLRNLEESIKLLKSNTDLLILPETFSTGFPSFLNAENLNLISQDEMRRTFETVRLLSSAYNLAIAGSMIVEDDRRYYNRGFFITPDGTIRFSDKKHLFSMAGENRFFHPGSKRMLINYKGWNIAMIICYDIRFPVWCRNVANEYDILLAVANWPSVRIGAWEKLLLARAIENEAFVVGVNCKGTDNNGYDYNGSSMIVDFKGDPIGYQEHSFIYADLSYEKLQKFRKKFPAWQDADQFKLI